MRKGSALKLLHGLAAVALLVAACSSGPEKTVARVDTTPSDAYTAGGKLSSKPQVINSQKVGRPYKIEGRWYVPARQDNYNQIGTASWYGPNFHGRPTANGEVFDQNALSAAHPTLPLPSYVKVTNLDNGRQAVVRVNDRGPFARDRILDLSKRSAEELGFINQGTARVRVEYLGPKSHELGKPWLYTAALENRSGVVGTQADATQRSVNLNPSSFFVQAAAFAETRRAEKARRSLAQVGPANIESVNIAGRKLHRVLVGPFIGSDEAEEARWAVARAGFSDARIVRRN